MRYINIFTAITTSLIIASCGSSENETQATPPAPTVDGNVQPTTSTTAATTTPATTTGTIAAPTIATTPGTNATQTAAVSTGGGGLNPEHGKPGHRCDIAVGAPLDSKPVTPTVSSPTTTPVTVSQPVVTPTSTSAPTLNTSSKTAAGMNPEHGKPGHRCDIAVGAPLDSKPIQATIQQPTTSAPAPKAALPYTPVTNQPAATTAVAKGMNPAHGQPGHRCDIAVGAPLDSKPTVQTGAVDATKPKQ